MWFGQSGDINSFPNFIQILAGTNFYCYFGDFPHEFLTVSWTHNTTQGMGATLVVPYSQTCDKYQNTSIYVNFSFFCRLLRPSALASHGLSNFHCTLSVEILCSPQQHTFLVFSFFCHLLRPSALASAVPSREVVCRCRGSRIHDWRSARQPISSSIGD